MTSFRKNIKNLLACTCIKKLSYKKYTGDLCDIKEPEPVRVNISKNKPHAEYRMTDKPMSPVAV